MFCDQCGGELQINQRFCSGCGKEVRVQVSFAGPRRGRVESHIRLLGIFWLSLSALDAVGGVAALVLANTLFSRWAPEGMPMFLHPLVGALGILSIVKSVGGFLAGWGLLNRQPWARLLAIILGGISLFFHIPFVTALVVDILWVLFAETPEEEYTSHQCTH